jgi:hypothetical protein
MDIKPYPKGEPTKQARNLFKMGVLKKYPIQKKRDDLKTTEGVDIIYDLKGVTPAVFKQIVDALLMAVQAEGERYKTNAYKYAKFTLELDLNIKGKKAGISTTRDYTSAKNSDTDTMIWGKDIDLPEGMKRPYLSDKAEEIIALLDSDSPGPYLDRRHPYKVTLLTICVREKVSVMEREDIKQMQRDAEEMVEKFKKEHPIIETKYPRRSAEEWLEMAKEEEEKYGP